MRVYGLTTRIAYVGDARVAHIRYTHKIDQSRSNDFECVIERAKSHQHLHIRVDAFGMPTRDFCVSSISYSNADTKPKCM